MTPRVAVFVDAGYLWACAAAHHGVTGRLGLTCDAAGLVDELSARASAAAGLPLLRVYWYDGARHGTPTPEHLGIARLAHTKLRMGRLTHGRQKGVDSLIHRDLVTLASNGAVDTAVLLSGDDDLTEGVETAQEHGVLVHLWGLQLPEGDHQSHHLQAACDDVDLLPPDLLDRCFSVTSSATPADVGAGFADEVGGRLTVDEVAALWSARPRIPGELDGELLARLGAEVPGYDEQAKRQARAGFWDRMAAHQVAVPASP